MDAGGAKHLPGVRRHQPEVQRLPRQLREQMEVEGRLRAGGLLRAGTTAADVSL